MSSERRTIRPYLGIGRIQAALDRLTLVAGTETRVPGEALVLDPHHYLASQVGLVLAEDDDGRERLVSDLTLGAEEAGLAPDELSLLVVATTTRLKIAEILFEASLDDLHTAELRLPLATAVDRPPALGAPFGGCRLDVYVVLRNPRPPEPLRPWRKGTWLGWVRFDLKTDVGEIGFTPIPMTDEHREQFGLAPGTLRFAVVEEPLESGATEESIQLYVDEQVLTELNYYRATPGSKAFQQQLFLDAMAALVYESSRQLNEADGSRTLDELEGSLIDKVINRLVGVTSGSDDSDARNAKEQWLTRVREQPALVLAHLEDKIPSLRRSVTNVLKEASS